MDKGENKGENTGTGRWDYWCAVGGGGNPGRCTSINLKGRVSIWVHPGLIKTSGLKGNSTTALGSGRAHTTCATGGGGGIGMGVEMELLGRGEWGGDI